MNRKFVIYIISLILILIITPAVYGSVPEQTLKINLKKNIDFSHFSLTVNGALLSNEYSLEELYTELDIVLDGKLTVGRNKFSTGPGKFTQLMISEEGPPLEMILLETNHRYFKAKQVVAFLGEGVNKQLFIHRIENSSLIPGFTIGLSESMMASKVIHPAYYNPIPFWPYYLTKKLLGINSVYDDNSDNYIGIDFSYRLKDNGHIYGELLVDEYPMLPRYNNPRKIAWIIGVDKSLQDGIEFAAELSRVRKNVYYHRHDSNDYFYKDEFIGHWGGADVAVIDFALTRQLKKDRSAKLNLEYVHRGDTNYIVNEADKRSPEDITYQDEYHLKFGYDGKYTNNLGYNILTDLAWHQRVNNISNNLTINYNLHLNF